MITTINEFRKLSLNESFSDLEQRINIKRDNLLVKISQNPNYCFIPKNQMKYDPCGPEGNCETNAWSFVKRKLENNIEHFFPVGGFMFQNDSLFPIEHWWVYDQHNKQHIEITTIDYRADIKCYAGIINYDIQNEIKKSNKYYDVDFFKGGNVYHWYFKNDDNNN